MRQVTLVAAIVIGFTVPGSAADMNIDQQAEADVAAYAAQIDATWQAIERSNRKEAMEKLATTSPELRNWEHDFLLAQASRLGKEGPLKPLSLKIDGRTVESLAFMPDGHRLLVGFGQKVVVVKVWDLMKDESSDLGGHQRLSGSVASSSDGKIFATAGIGGDIFLWDAVTGKIQLQYKGHQLPADSPYGQSPLTVKKIDFSPDSKRIVSLAYTDTDFFHPKCEVKVWSVETGETLMTLEGKHAKDRRHFLVCVSFSPDGKQIATGGFDKTLKIWDAVIGKEIRTIQGHENNVLEVAFSPDGKRIATASTDRTLAVWDVDTGHELLRLKGHSGPIFSVKFSPDGKRLVSGGWDRSVRIWNAQVGTPLLTLAEMPGPVLAVAISADGKRIAAGGGVYGDADRCFAATVWDSSIDFNEK